MFYLMFSVRDAWDNWWRLLRWYQTQATTDTPTLVTGHNIVTSPVGTSGVNEKKLFHLLGVLSLVLMSREEMFVTKTEVFTIVTILLSLIHFSFLTLSSPCFASVFQSKKNLCCCVVLFSENTKQEVSQLEAVQVDLTIVRENKKGITTAKTDLAAKKQFRYIWCKIFLVEILSSVGVVLRY